MASNNFPDVFTKSNPSETCCKSTQRTCRKTPTPTCKSSESYEIIPLKSQVFIGTFPIIQRIPIEHPR